MYHKITESNCLKKPESRYISLVTLLWFENSKLASVASRWHRSDVFNVKHILEQPVLELKSGCSKMCLTWCWEKGMVLKHFIIMSFSQPIMLDATFVPSA